MQKNKKLFILSLTSALIFSFLISIIPFSASCEEMYDNIVRVRIIANSNNEKDQTLKLAVRDAILKDSVSLFPNDADYDEIVLIAKENLDAFLKTAEKTVSKNGFNYSVKAEIRQEFFGTREYDNFTLPSGNYETLVITLGEGKGENWWCVMFPSVCIGACSGNLNDSISETSAEKAYNSEKYTAKFKVVEIYESIKHFFTKT